MLRTQKTHEAYLQEEKVFELETFEILSEYEHWLIVKNNYPYDNVAEKHHMLIPKRRVPKFTELTHVEISEHNKILGSEFVETSYDCVLKNLSRARSVKGWWHEHLIRWKA